MNAAVMNADPVDEFWQGIELSRIDWEIERYLFFKMALQYRETLDKNHIIAQAMDKNEPWSAIAEYADASGHDEFAEALRFAERLFGKHKKAKSK